MTTTPTTPAPCATVARWPSPAGRWARTPRPGPGPSPPPPAVLVAAVAATMAAAVGQKAHCIQQGWTGSDQFWHACFSDLPAQYQLGHLDSGLAGYVGGTGVTADHPVLSGAVMAVLGGLVPDGSFLAQTRWYFALWALLATVLAAVLVWLTATSRPRHASMAAQVALSPVLLLAGLVSVDLLGVVLASAGLWAWARRRPVQAGVLLGLAVTARTYPVLLLLALVLLGVRTGAVPGRAQRAGRRSRHRGRGAVALPRGQPLGDPALHQGLVGGGAGAGLTLDAAAAGRPVGSAGRRRHRPRRGGAAGHHRHGGPVRALHLAPTDPRRGGAGAGGARPGERQGLPGAGLALARPARGALWDQVARLARLGRRRGTALRGGLALCRRAVHPDRGLPAGWYAFFLVLRLAATGYLVWRVWRTAAQRPEAPTVGEAAADAPPEPERGSQHEPDPDSDAVVDELAGDFTDAPDQLLVRLG